MQAEPLSDRRQILEQIIGRVGEGRENDDLTVARIQGLCDFLFQNGKQVLKLGIVFGCHHVHRSD